MILPILLVLHAILLQTQTAATSIPLLHEESVRVPNVDGNVGDISTRNPPKCDETPQNRYTSLVCWLWDLQLTLPDEHIRKGLISLSIRDMLCTDFQITSTESKYIPAPNMNPKLEMKLHGISAQCIGKYKAGLAGGEVKVLIDNIENEALYIELSIQSTMLHPNISMYDSLPTRAPSATNLTACSTNLQVPEEGGISFSGSISAKFVDLFSKSIAARVTSTLNSQICPQLEEVLGNNVTSALMKMDSFLEQFISDDDSKNVTMARELGSNYRYHHNSMYSGGNANMLAVIDEDLLQWDELAELKNIIEAFSIFSNAHLDKGILLTFLERVGWPISLQDCTDCGYFFRGVNGLIKNVTENGSWSTNLNREVDFSIKRIGEISITLQNMSISGLDRFNHIEISPLPPRDIVPKIMMKDLNLCIGVDMKIFPMPGGLIRDNPLEESFDIVVNASDIILDVAIDLGIIRNRIRNTTVNDLGLPHRRKLFESLSHITLTKAIGKGIIDAIKIYPLNPSDALEISLDEMINNGVTLILHEYKELVSKSLEAIIRGPIVVAVNKIISDIIRNITSVAVGHFDDDDNSATKRDESSTDYYNFNESHTILWIHELFSSDCILEKVNRYIGCISSFLDENPLSSNSLISAVDDFNILIESASFQNFKVDELDVLEPVDAIHLDVDARTSISQNATSIFMMDFQYPNEEIYVSTKLNSSLSGLRGKFGNKLLFNTTQFQNLNLYKLVTDLSSTIAPLSANSGIFDLAASVKEFNLEVLMSLSHKGEDRQIKFSSSQRDQFSQRITEFLFSSSKVVQNCFNGFKTLYLDAEPIQTNDERRDKNIYTTTMSQQWIVLLFFIAFNIPFLMKSPAKSLRKKQKATHGNYQSSSSPVPLSLLFHDKISHMLRLIIPLGIVLTIAIFIVSNFSVGAWVNIKLSRPDGSTVLKIPGVTTFSLGKTVTEMYHAKVYTLMALVLVFSGIWPYVKLLMMFLSWISPVSIMPFETREWFLTWLDALGKYSLVDSFVLVLMLVSFKFHINFPGVGTIDSYVIPAFGFYLFLLGTVLSLIIGHGVTFLHRFTKLPNLKKSTTRQSLGNHHFHFIDSVGGVRFAKLSPAAHMYWALITTICITFLCIGATKKSFTFEFQGLLGEILGDNSSARYSLWTLGTSLPQSVEDPNSFGVIIIQITFFFFALVMPLACLITVSILFYVPMTLRCQQIMFMLSEIANAWSAIDVFLLSVLASLAELSQFAAFMVGDHCDIIKNRFFQDLLMGEDTCFSVESKVSLSVLYLTLGVAMYNLIVFCGLRLAHDALEERMFREGHIHGEGNLPNHERSSMVSTIVRSVIPLKFFFNTIP